MECGSAIFLADCSFVVSALRSCAALAEIVSTIYGRPSEERTEALNWMIACLRSSCQRYNSGLDGTLTSWTA